MINKGKGFTLIELVVVIIILGILAVTAAPKFINLQSDARVSSLQGIKGAIQGANTLVYSKASLAGQQTSNSAAVNIGPTTVSTRFGYIQGNPTSLTSAIDISLSDWVVVQSGAVGNGVVEIRQQGAPTTCNFTYTHSAVVGELPTYGTLPSTADC